MTTQLVCYSHGFVNAVTNRDMVDQTCYQIIAPGERVVAKLVVIEHASKAISKIWKAGE
jgi:precorrin-6B methylase 2